MDYTTGRSSEANQRPFDIWALRIGYGGRATIRGFGRRRRRRLAFDLLAQLVDEPAASAIEPGQQTAPDVAAGPEPFAGDGIVHGEIGVGGPVAEMKGQIGSEAALVVTVGQRLRFHLGREDEEQVRLLAAANDAEAAPFFQFAERFVAHGRESGLVLEVNELGGQ